jgi:hypothetical protein
MAVFQDQLRASDTAFNEYPKICDSEFDILETEFRITLEGAPNFDTSGSNGAALRSSIQHQ